MMDNKTKNQIDADISGILSDVDCIVSAANTIINRAKGCRWLADHVNQELLQTWRQKIHSAEMALLEARDFGIF